MKKWLIIGGVIMVLLWSCFFLMVGRLPEAPHKEGVKLYLESHLNDPRSLEFIEWSPLGKTENGNPAVRAKYRVKNFFGGYDVKNEMFFLDPFWRVTQSMDWELFETLNREILNERKK